MRNKKTLVIQHIAFEDLGNLTPVLKEMNYSIDYVHACDLEDNKKLSESELLIILGGPIGAYQEATYPFLKKELALIQYRLQNKLPILGICLGAQLIARALGARVYPGERSEIGWSALIDKTTSRNNPLAPIIANDTPVLHWHGDTFDLPPGAIRLASSQWYENQAFSVGMHCLGLQFHPEVTKAGMEKWFVGHAHEINHTPDISVEQLRQDTLRYADNLTQKSKLLWRYWLSQQKDATNGGGCDE